jgi:hypothetical protein
MVEVMGATVTVETITNRTIPSKHHNRSSLIRRTEIVGRTSHRAIHEGTLPLFPELRIVKRRRIASAVTFFRGARL